MTGVFDQTQFGAKMHFKNVVDWIQYLLEEWDTQTFPDFGGLSIRINTNSLAPTYR